MTLLVKVEPNKITLKLLKNKRLLDSETFSYYHDLDAVLIIALDKLLKRNNIDTTALNSFKIQGNTGENSTSYKIVVAFVEGLRVRV